MEVRQFGKAQDAMAVPDLIEIQTKSYEDFLQSTVDSEKRADQGLEALLREIFPISSYDGKYSLDYLKYELGKPLYSIDQCRQLRLTYGRPFRIWVRLNKEQPIEEEVYLGELPIMIGGGEFIINGAERVLVSQLHRSPGVDFMVDTESSERRMHAARIIPERGSWVEMNVTKKEVLVVRIDQSGKFPVTMFLRAMSPDYSDNAAIIREFYTTKEVRVTGSRSFRALQGKFLVEDIVDSDTGEVVIEGGSEVTELNFATLLEALGNTIIPEVTDAHIDKYITDTFEYKWFELPEEFQDRTVAGDIRKYFAEKGPEFETKRNVSAVDTIVKLASDRIAVEFADRKKEDKERRHLPRYNDEIPGAPTKVIKSAFGKELDKAFKKWISASIREAKSDTGWHTKLVKGVPEGPGVFVFRSKETKRPHDGFVGMAPTSGGLQETLSVHMQGGGDSGFREHMRAAVLGILKKTAVQRNIPDDENAPTVEIIDEKNPDVLLLNTLSEDASESHESALMRIYARLRPGNPAQVEKARDLFAEKFYDSNRYRLGAVGRFRMNRKFGTDIDEEEQNLKPEDVVNCIKYILGLRRNEGRIDDIDHLGNRRVRTLSELASDEIRKGFLKLRRTVQERMSLGDQADMSPRTLVNSKTISSSIDYFFGRGELSQVVDQTNPLSQLAHERRLSALGPGGLNRKRAGFEVRDVHISHYGRICPIETPEGSNIGLISNVSIFARVDRYGFLITPYRVVNRGKVTDEIVYLRADQEEDTYIAPADQDFSKDTVLARLNGDFLAVEKKQIQYVDISPRQLVGVSAGLIPFLEHDDANRALMGSNMQRQAVPLIRCEAPLVSTGLEMDVPRYSGMVVIAENSGTVDRLTADEIVVGDHSYKLRKFVGLNERTCLNQKPIVSLGDRVRKGQVIADGAGTKEGELALGRNVLVGFMPWDGYNYEDAILVSEKLVQEDAYTSIHIEEFEVEIRETKLGREEFTRDIPNVSERELASLDEHGIIAIGTRVKPGDILVGKIAPKSKSELTPEEKLLQAIFGRAGEDVKNDSLEVPAGIEGIVIHTERFQRKVHLTDIERLETENLVRLKKEEFDEKKAVALKATLEAIEELVDARIPLEGKKRPLSRIATTSHKKLLELVDKLTFESLHFDDAKIEKEAAVLWGRYRREAEELSDECDRETGRIRRGDKLPSGVLELVKIYVATKRTLSVGDKMAGRHGNKGVIAKILPVEDMPFLEDGTPLDIVLNPLGVPSRMNVGQILETHLGWAARALGFKAICPVFDGPDEEEINAALEEAGLPSDGKVTLYDGRTGDSFTQKVTVGYIYMMKLHHLVDDKVHARATGPYSLITQQPLGGKARSGGQRFGEMEVWALEAYGAAHVLQEILTVKSDDVEGRTKIYESMIKGENTLEAGTPVSFEVLTNEIKGLCLNMELLKRRAAI